MQLQTEVVVPGEIFPAVAVLAVEALVVAVLVVLAAEVPEVAARAEAGKEIGKFNILLIITLS